MNIIIKKIPQLDEISISLSQSFSSKNLQAIINNGLPIILKWLYILLYTYNVRNGYCTFFLLDDLNIPYQFLILLVPCRYLSKPNKIFLL